MTNLVPTPGLVPIYDRDTDSVQLVNKSGDILAVIPRNMVIRMLATLPANPPAKVAP
ncbi:MAG: hypothetical protein VW338_00130 [Rhodospirillaceae bacterium]